MSSVIDYTWFSWIRAIFIVINAKAGIAIPVINQIVIADTTETDTIFCVSTQWIIRKLGDNAGPES